MTNDAIVYPKRGELVEELCKSWPKSRNGTRSAWHHSCGVGDGTVSLFTKLVRLVEEQFYEDIRGIYENSYKGQVISFVGHDHRSSAVFSARERTGSAVQDHGANARDAPAIGIKHRSLQQEH